MEKNENYIDKEDGRYWICPRCKKEFGSNAMRHGHYYSGCKDPEQAEAEANPEVI